MTQMPAPDTSAAPNLHALAIASSCITAASTYEPLFSNAKITEIIRHIPDKRIIARGDLDGRAAVFRIYRTAPEDCARDWQELSRIWPNMNRGALQVCAPLACAPDCGVLAVADVPGTPLLKWIYRAEVADKARYLPGVAHWLRSYTDTSESEVKAAPAGWVRRAERAAKAQEFKRLRRIERSILIEIKRLVPLIEGTLWRHAIGHGDFHPNNLIVNQDRITGIDCGGSRPAPIYKDMARFLMHMGRRNVIPSGEMYLGVDRQGMTTFADAFTLSENERGLTLPFFIAVEALMRAETRNLPQSRIRRARKMSESLLKDLEGIGV